MRKKIVISNTKNPPLPHFKNHKFYFSLTFLLARNLMISICIKKSENLENVTTNYNNVPNVRRNTPKEIVMKIFI